MESETRPITVLIADDHELVRAGLKRVLEESGDMRVVGEASDGPEALDVYQDLRPDVVIMDISMPGMDGLETVDRLLASHRDARILVLTMHSEEHYALRALKAGCMGYLTKEGSTQQLREAVRAVSRGQRFLSSSGKDVVTSQLLTRRRTGDTTNVLSDRELQVLCMLARGLKLKEIAGQLNLSVRTVETYESRVRTKLNLRNKAEISRFAYQNKLI